MNDNDNNLKRQLFEEFTKNGFSFEGCSMEHIAEMLLQFCVKNRKREDIPALAEKILDNYGDVRNFIFSDRSTLKFLGLDDDEADHIEFIAALFRRISSDSYKLPIDYSDEKLLESYLKALFRFDPVEKLYLFPVVDKKIIDCRFINEGVEDSMNFDINILIRILSEYPDCHEYILAHNHPRNFSKPSSTDIASTKLFAGKLRLMGYELIAHYTIGIDGMSRVLHEINYIQYLFGGEE